MKWTFFGTLGPGEPETFLNLKGDQDHLSNAGTHGSQWYKSLYISDMVVNQRVEGLLGIFSKQHFTSQIHQLIWQVTMI